MRRTENPQMDVDAELNTAREFGIMSIPTLLFKKDGRREASRRCSHQRPAQGYRGIKLSKKPEACTVCQ